MALIEINSQNFEQQVINSKNTVILDFWATWCGPCQMIAPVIKEVAQENPDITVGKIDVDECPELASKFGIVSIPTIVAVKDGKETQRIVGFRPKADILKYRRWLPWRYPILRRGAKQGSPEAP